jgi:hypothetical protein
MQLERYRACSPRMNNVLSILRVEYTYLRSFGCLAITWLEQALYSSQAKSQAPSPVQYCIAGDMLFQIRLFFFVTSQPEPACKVTSRNGDVNHSKFF